MPAGEVFSRVQDHVIAAARAHVERLVLEAFVEKCRSVPEGELRSALNLLCDLHALAGIEADRGLVPRARQALHFARSKAITREVGELLRRVRPIAGDLVAAFGVPRELLRAAALVGARTGSDRSVRRPRSAGLGAGPRTRCGRGSTTGPSSTRGSAG